MSPQTRRVNPWTAVTTLSIGFFMIMLDTSIVNVAIPTMLRELHATLNQIVWVNSVYLLTCAVPLLFAGRLGDRLGRKTMFLAGMALFTAASLWCGLSATPGVLIAARAVQGLGAATMAPQTMALIAHLFPPDRRGAAMGVWGGTGAVAGATGPLLGGVLVSSFGWQSIFMVNVPIGVIGLAMAALFLPAAPARRGNRFDVFGTTLSGLGLAALVFGLQNGQQYRWGKALGPVTIPEILIAGVVLMITFVVWQRLNRGDPLLPLPLIRNRNFAAASVAVAAVAFALTGMYLPLTIYLQSVLGLSPLMAGLTTLPTPLSAAVASPLAGKLSDRISGKYVSMAGCAVFAVGICLIAALARTDTNPWTLRFALVGCGFGAGCAFSPLVNVATSSVPLPLMGAASGVYNTFRQVGSVIGIAAVGVMLQARLALAIHAAAIARAASLPAGLRQPFVAGMSNTATSATLSAGPARTPLHSPVSGLAARGVASAAAGVFHDGFTQAARLTLLVPAGMLLIGLVTCFAMARRLEPQTRTVTEEIRHEGTAEAKGVRAHRVLPGHLPRSGLLR